MGLVGALVGIGIMGILIMVMTSLVTTVREQQRSMNLLINLDQARLNLASLIRIPSYWQESIANNPALECLIDLSSNPPCPHDSPQAFTLFSPGPTVVFDGASQGLSTSGDVCNRDEDNCLFDLNLTVHFVCPTPPGPCLNPIQVVVEGQFDLTRFFDSGGRLAFNPENYMIRIINP